MRYCKFCEEFTRCYRNDQIWYGEVLETYYCCECNQKVE